MSHKLINSLAIMYMVVYLALSPITSLLPYFARAEQPEQNDGNSSSNSAVNKENQEIEICFTTLNSDGESIYNVPDDSVFSLSFYQAGNSTSEVTYSNENVLNQDKFGNDDVNDSYCSLYEFEHNSASSFFYDEEIVTSDSDQTWKSVKYNDEFEANVTIHNDFDYYKKLFGDEYNPVSDGHMVLSSSNGNKTTLMILNQLEFVNHPPLINEIPSQEIYLNESFQSVYLPDLSSDEDGDNLIWTLENNPDQVFSIDENNYLISNIPLGWSGEVNLKVIVTDEYDDFDYSETVFRVLSTERDKVAPESIVKIIVDETEKEFINSKDAVIVKISGQDVAQENSIPSGIYSVRFSPDGLNWEISNELEVSDLCRNEEENCNIWDGSAKSINLSSLSRTYTGVFESKNSVYIETTDNEGNVSINYASFIFDKTSPTGEVYIGRTGYDRSNTPFTNSYTNYVTYQLSDESADSESNVVSGLDRARLSTDGISFSDWFEVDDSVKTYIEEWTEESTDLNIVIEVQDKAGNIGTVSDDITYRNLKPVGKVVINNNENYTNKSLVALRITLENPTESEVSKMRVKYCDSECLLSGGWSGWNDYKQGVITSLVNPQQSGVKTICVQLKGIAENVSDEFCDTIILDNEVPTGSILINEGEVNTQNGKLNLKINASDDPLDDGENGVGELNYRVSIDAVNWSNWIQMSGAEIQTEIDSPNISGEVFVYVEFKDKFGNKSKIYSDNILVDFTTESVGGFLKINNGDLFTNYDTVNLNIESDSEYSDMKIWNEGEDENDAAWEKFQNLKHWSIYNSDTYGIKRVNIKFRDASGESEIYFDEIIYAPIYAVEYSDVNYSTEQYTLQNHPNEILSSSNLPFVLYLRNKGTLTWTPQNEFTFTSMNPVNLSYHWYWVNDNGEEVEYLFEGSRGLISKSIFFDQGDDVSIDVYPPIHPGKYKLKFDLVHEGILWFSEKGNEMPEIIFDVVQNPDYPIQEECNPEIDNCGNVLGDMIYEGEYGIGVVTYAKLISQSYDGYIEIKQGETIQNITAKYLTSGFVNTSMNLVTNKPFQRESSFWNESWVDLTTASQYLQEFNLSFSVPYNFTPGYYRECFIPLDRYYVQISNSDEVCWTIRVLENPDAVAPSTINLSDGGTSYKASLYTAYTTSEKLYFRPGQAIYSYGGETIIAAVNYKNVGTERWPKGVSMVTIDPYNHDSEFRNYDWISKSQPTFIEDILSVGYNTTLRFRFNIPYDISPGSYEVCFGLVISERILINGSTACYTIIIPEVPMQQMRHVCTSTKLYVYDRNVSTATSVSVGTNVWILGTASYHTFSNDTGFVYYYNVRLENGFIGSIAKDSVCDGIVDNNDNKGLLISQSHEGILNLSSGQEVTVNAIYKNIGKTQWYREHLFLDTYSPLYRNSEFYGDDWMDATRMGRYIENTDVLPGGQITYQFNFKVPENITSGTYTECFMPRFTYNATMNVDPLCWTISIIDQEVPAGRVYCTEGTDLYSSIDGEIVDHVSYDSTIYVLETNENWIKISLDGTNYLWMKDGCFEQTGTTTNPALSVSEDPISEPQGTEGVAMSVSGLKLREGPSVIYPVVAEIPYGTFFEVIAQAYTDNNGVDLWYEVELIDGRTGWIPAGYVNISEDYYPEVKNIEPLLFEEARVCGKTGRKELYYAPDFNSRLIDLVYSESNIVILSREGNWVQVMLVNGRVGYMYYTSVCSGFGGVKGELNEVDGVEFDYPLMDSFEITSLFGERNGYMHTGLDMGVDCGTPIYASADGYVSEVSSDGVSLGNESDSTTPSSYIIIEHANGYKTYYWHLSEVGVEVGDYVFRNEYIGKTGNSGYVRGNPEDPVEEQGCHLHFEIRDENNIPRDPLEIIDPNIHEDILNELINNYLWDIEDTDLLIGVEQGVGQLACVYQDKINTNPYNNLDIRTQKDASIEFEVKSISNKQSGEIIMNKYFDAPIITSIDILNGNYVIRGMAYTESKGINYIVRNHEGVNCFLNFCSDQVSTYTKNGIVNANDVKINLWRNKSNGEFITWTDQIDEMGRWHVEVPVSQIQSYSWLTAEMEVKVDKPVIFNLPSKNGYSENVTLNPRNYSNQNWYMSVMGSNIEIPTICIDPTIVGGNCSSPYKGMYDVCPSNVFYPYIYDLVVVKNVLSGYSDGNFKPNNNVTRGELAKFIVNAFNLEINTSGTQFPDVGTDNNFFKYIQTLKNLYVVKGYTDGTFKPDNNVLRGETAKMVILGASMEMKSGCGDFGDVDQSNVFYKYIIALKCSNIVDGDRNGNFNPLNNISRGETAKIIDLVMRYYTSPNADENRKIFELEKIFTNVVRDGIEHEWCGTQVQDYTKIGGYGDSMIIYNPNKDEAFLVTGKILEYYYEKGACGTLGLPNSNQWSEQSSCGTNGISQHFEDAQIFSVGSKTTSMLYNGFIRDYYETEGKIQGIGWPIAEFGDEVKNKLNEQFPDVDGGMQGDPDGDWVDGMLFEKGVIGQDDDTGDNPTDSDDYLNERYEECVECQDCSVTPPTNRMSLEDYKATLPQELVTQVDTTGHWGPSNLPSELVGYMEPGWEDTDVPAYNPTGGENWIYNAYIGTGDDYGCRDLAVSRHHKGFDLKPVYFRENGTLLRDYIYKINQDSSQEVINQCQNKEFYYNVNDIDFENNEFAPNLQNKHDICSHSQYLAVNEIGYEALCYDVEDSVLIFASQNGIVESAEDGSFSCGTDPAYLIRIYNENSDMGTLYLHLRYLYVEEGDYIRAGEPIGIMGNTGLAFGRHLHYEVCDGTCSDYTRANFYCDNLVISNIRNRLDPYLYINH